MPPTLPPCAGHRALGKLASGGMGVVYLALSPDGRELRALKTMFRQRAEDPARRALFEAEGALLEAHQGPGLPALHARGTAENGVPFLAMEALRGEELADVLARGPLDLLPALDVLEDVAATLARLHAAGVVHRDLKPSNVFRTREGRTLVLDLGVAAAVATGAPAPATFLYAAPEQNRGEDATPSSDLYALGLVAFECLTGTRALAAEDPRAALHEQAADSIPDPRDFEPMVPSTLAELVVAATRAAPAARPPGAAAFGEALAALRYTLEATRPEVFRTRRLRRAYLAGALELAALESAVPGDPWNAWMRCRAARTAGDLPGAGAALAEAGRRGLSPADLALEAARLALAAGDPDALEAARAELASLEPGDRWARALEELGSLDPPRPAG